MELSFVSTNITNPATLVPAILKFQRPISQYEAFKDYEPERHNANSRTERPDKIIAVEAVGNLTDENGNPLMTTKVVKANRILAPLQKRIVDRAADFLTLGKVKLDSKPANDTEQALLDAVNRTWRSNKLNTKNGTIARHMMSETECCEIWYSQVNEQNQIELRMKVFAPSGGNALIPIFDRFGDLISFAIKYETTDAGTPEKTTRHVDLYTKEQTAYYIETVGGWQLAPAQVGANGKAIPNPLPNPYGKIPVIYYWQPKAEWADVQTSIDRLETMVSNLADMNDYHASPTIVAKGDIKGFAQKGEQGKLLEIEENAELQYLEYSGASETIKLEYELLKENIFSYSQTPDLSTREMKELGDISGVAFDRILIDAHMKAMARQNGDFGEMIQRRLNFLIAALAKILNKPAAAELEITPVFSLFQPFQDKERIEIAIAANGGKAIMSQKESIVYSGTSEDADATLEAIKTEAQEAQQQVTDTNPAEQGADQSA